MSRSLQAKKIAIMLDQQYQELEVWYPYFRFKEEGADVILAAPEARKTYPSKLGYPCTSDAAAREVKLDTLDAVIVPGGWCPDFMRRDESMIRFIQEAAKRNMLLAAICHGGWMLCCTQALRGRRATSFIGIKHDMLNAGASWVDEQCVVDGNIITARKPEDLPAFCAAIIAVLAKKA